MDFPGQDSCFYTLPKMAWRCSGSTMSQLIQNMVSKGIISDSRVEQVMSSIDRKKFVVNPDIAYIDAPQGIGYNATISAPHMV